MNYTELLAKLWGATKRTCSKMWALEVFDDAKQIFRVLGKPFTAVLFGQGMTKLFFVVHDAMEGHHTPEKFISALYWAETGVIATLFFLNSARDLFKAGCDFAVSIADILRDAKQGIKGGANITETRPHPAVTTQQDAGITHNEEPINNMGYFELDSSRSHSAETEKITQPEQIQQQIGQSSHE